MKLALFVLLIAAALAAGWRCLVRLNREIENALAEPTDLELGVRQLYDTEKLERELLDGARPR